MKSIELTTEEKDLASQIEFDPSKVCDNEDWKRNSELAFRLGASLLKRKAVPDHRLRYFNDPEYHIGGRNKSRRDNWRANGNSDEKILRHNNFLPFLRYFIFGPAVPQALFDQFKSKVDSFGQFTSGDATDLTQFARKLWREYGKVYDAEDFYQLALECGVGNFFAPFVHRAIKQAR